MRLTSKILAVLAAAGAWAALSAAPAQAQGVNFSVQFGNAPYGSYNGCYWQRLDRGRHDLVRQVCRDRFGRAFVVPGTAFNVYDRNRRDWRRWQGSEWRRYDRWDGHRNHRDWNQRDRRNDRWRDHDRRDRHRDRDRRHRDRDRHDRWGR